MSKLKVISFVGTRPEIIRLVCVLKELDRNFNHVFVATGQSFDKEMYDIFFSDFELRKPDYFLGVKSDTIGGQIANILSKGEEVLIEEKPDALLVLGDTNSALITIIAKRHKIPIFHMEAGNRCFDENVPEEINRKIVDHISDINLPYTEHSRRYLINEGIHPGSVYVTGSPLAEVYSVYKNKINESKILEKLKLKNSDYFLASFHREENVTTKNSLNNIIEAINSLADIYQKRIIVSTHPRTKKILKENKIKVNKKIEFLKPFGYLDYMKLQKESICVISDSGTIQEESAIVGFPAVQIRTSSERPEAFDAGTIILAGNTKEQIVPAVEMSINHFKRKIRFNIPKEYKNDNVAVKVSRLIMGLSIIIKNNKYNN